MTNNGPPEISPVRKLLHLFAAGFFFVLSVIGVIFPGIPTTPFLLLTSYFLARSSPKWNERLLRSKLFGPILTDWQQRGGVRQDVKFRAAFFVTILVVVSLAWQQPPLWLGGLTAVLASIGILVIFCLPTIDSKDPEDTDASSQP